MTVSTTNTDFAAHGHSAIWASTRNFFAGLAAGYNAYLAYSRLDALSDAQLAARGLTRQDVPRAAVNEMIDGQA